MAHTARAWNIVPDPQIGQYVGWGGEVFDLDNDGFEDIVVTYGIADSPNEAGADPDQPDEIYRQVAPGTFEPVAAAWGFDHSDPHVGLVLADLDGNGFVDTVRRRPGGYLRVDYARCDDSAWLDVTLSQPGENPDALGAVVRVEAGDERWTQLVQQGGNSYRAGAPPVAHFGLGDRDAVDALEVTWPDGAVERFDGVETRRALRVARGR